MTDKYKEEQTKTIDNYHKRCGNPLLIVDITLPALTSFCIKFNYVTNDHESVLSRRLLRQSEEESEDACDGVETEEGLSEGVLHPADRCVRSSVRRYDVGMEVDVIDAHSVQNSGHFATDPLRLI